MHKIAHAENDSHRKFLTLKIAYARICQKLPTQEIVSAKNCQSKNIPTQKIIKPKIFLCKRLSMPKIVYVKNSQSKNISTQKIAKIKIFLRKKLT